MAAPLPPSRESHKDGRPPSPAAPQASSLVVRAWSQADEATLLPRVRALGAPVSARYGEAGRLGHYRAVARKLGRLFHDPELARAGFLHGVPLETARSLPGLSARTLSLLEEWQALQKLSTDKGDIAASAYTGSVEGLALCVHDCLLSSDPQGRVLRWTQGFPLHASPVPVALPEASAQDRPRLQRLQRVVVPLARAWGFHIEGDALDNAVLLQLDQALASKLLAHVLEASSSPWGISQQVEQVKQALARAGWEKACGWEWRHLGSIARQLASYSSTEWSRALFRCGFVTVLCRGEDDCYRTLQHLHRAANHRRGQVSDYIGAPSPAGYRAIHTTLLVTGEDHEPLTIAVRLLPRRLRKSRFLQVDHRRVGSLEEGHRSGVDPSIRVFTPTGEQHRLPPGATVLDLAYRIHRDFVAMSDHAVVNGRAKVGLLHPLQDSDEVHLVMADQPRQLPEGWEASVLASNRVRLRQAYHNTWRALLAKEGLRQLQRRLVRLQADQRLVRVLFEMAMAELEREDHGGPSRPADWWLAGVGAHRGSLSSPAGVRVDLPDQRLIERLVQLVEEKAERLVRIYEGTEVRAPGELRGSLERVVWCPTCSPSEHESELAVTVRRRRSTQVLVVHRRGEPCAEGGMPMDIEDRLSLDQFFVIETDNEVGVALQVLDVFRHEGVNVVEVVGRRLGPGWGVFRIEVDPVDRATILEVRRRLELLDNVFSIRTPLDPGPGVLEVSLPPRQAAHRGAFFRPVPYVAGPIAVEDHLFYGREVELGALWQLLRQVRDGDAASGVMAFARGPLRMGKTSLVRRFELLLKRQPELYALPVYLKASVDEGWEAFRSRLEEALVEAARETLQQWGIDAADFTPRGLQGDLEALLALRQRPTVVLIVDEVHRLLGEVSKHPEARRQLSAFRDFVERSPRLMLLWTGPSHGPQALHPEVADLLLSSHLVPVEPFALDDTLAMLEARKMALHQSITIDKRLVRHLHHLTGGEPFWLAHIANLMWMRCARSGQGTVRFDRALATTAVRDLLERHELFATRIEPRRPDRTRAATWRVATALASAEDARYRGRWGLTVDELSELLEGSSPSLTTAEIATALEVLQDRGAVLLAGTQPMRWRLSSPLLADYLLLHKQRASRRPPCSA